MIVEALLSFQMSALLLNFAHWLLIYTNVSERCRYFECFRRNFPFLMTVVSLLTFVLLRKLVFNCHSYVFPSCFRWFEQLFIIYRAMVSL